MIFFTFPKMKPKINIIDLRLLERSLSATVFTVIKIASYYTSYFDQNMERVRVKSDIVAGGIIRKN